MITLTVSHPGSPAVTVDLSGLEGLTADKAAEVLRGRHPGIEVEVGLAPNREIPFTEVLEAAVDAHPPIPEPPMGPCAVMDPTVLANIRASLGPDNGPTRVTLNVSDDAIDRAQIAALGGYPADLCGVWERARTLDPQEPR